MFRTFITAFIFTLILLPFYSSASDSFRIEDCDELIALNRDYSGKMLCWNEHDNTKDTYSYSGKIYQNGKFSDISDGEYVSKKHTRSFRAEKGYVMFHKDRAYLEKENEADTDKFAEFYEANFEGLQRVYICVHDVTKKTNVCNPAGNKTYKTRNNVTFETNESFLKEGCHYSDKGIICENRG